MLDDDIFLEAIVDRFEGEFAVLKLKTGDELNWPKSKLTPDIHEGSVVFLQAFSSQKTEEEREKLAKAILNKILNLEKE
jgi:hypothetical protein